MLRALTSDVVKILLYVAGSLVLGAALAPWLYNLGMGIAEVTQGKETNGVLEWLGNAARRSQDNFPRFFDRSLMLAAVVLLFPLLAWLRLGRGAGRYRDTPWSLKLPDEAVVMDRGQPLRRDPQGWTRLVLGFLLAGGLLLVSGWVMIEAGFFMWRDAEGSSRGLANPARQAIDWLGALKGALPTAVVVSLVEEVLFRGVLLGIFLRTMRPAAAIVSLSLLFAFVHFLEPPVGARVPDPEALNAGFVLLGQIFTRFADPMSMAGRFAVLAAVGVVLGVARWRTASLWLPVGLHMGWVFCFALFKSATWPVPGLPEAARWLVGGTLLEGLLPLALVLITGLVVGWITRPEDEEPLG